MMENTNKHLYANDFPRQLSEKIKRGWKAFSIEKLRLNFKISLILKIELNFMKFPTDSPSTQPSQKKE